MKNEKIKMNILFLLFTSKWFWKQKCQNCFLSSREWVRELLTGMSLGSLNNEAMPVKVCFLEYSWLEFRTKISGIFFLYTRETKRTKKVYKFLYENKTKLFFVFAIFLLSLFSPLVFHFPSLKIFYLLDNFCVFLSLCICRNGTHDLFEGIIGLALCFANSTSIFTFFLSFFLGFDVFVFISRLFLFSLSFSHFALCPLASNSFFLFAAVFPFISFSPFLFALHFSALNGVSQTQHRNTTITETFSLYPFLNGQRIFESKRRKKERKKTKKKERKRMRRVEGGGRRKSENENERIERGRQSQTSKNVWRERGGRGRKTRHFVCFRSKRQW